jgi:hypothetical protein
VRRFFPASPLSSKARPAEQGTFAKPILFTAQAENREATMIKLGVGIAFLLMATSASFAQDYCEQVKQGIEQYGYAAARQYAVEHYTPEEVRAADRCVVKLRLRHNS